jgi:signal transduction histidine kinase
MITNLKIAIKKQNKLITLFLLTILLPAVVLSIFGITAIQNERFKIAQQYENEHKRIAELLKQSINSHLSDVQILLTNMVKDPVLLKKDYKGIKKTIDNSQISKKMIEQFIIIYKDESPFFPLFPPATHVDAPLTRPSLNAAQKEKLKRAETSEYVHKKYALAITQYNELFVSVKNKGDQARMLNHIGRNLIKQNKYRQVIKIYDKIINDYSDQRTSSRLPLTLIAHLQKVECYQQLNDIEKTLKEALDLYNKILQHSLPLNEDQFFTYTEILMEKISDLMDTTPAADTYRREFERLSSLHKNKFEQWKIVDKLSTVCIPELREKFIEAKPDSLKAFHYSKNIDQKNYLITGVCIPDPQRRTTLGLLAIKIKNHHLEGEILNDIIGALPLNINTMIKISDLSGNLLYGYNSHSDKFYNIIDFLDNNFPPWRIEIADTHVGEQDILAIHKSFYFWTILTLIIILVFGLILIIKTVSHEMDILKIKSDFVSSVSHEFKTPLTSIQALTERLREGKVKNQAKMQEYFSVISRDTDKLTRLVGNILNFSKIEEGKIVYEFVETEISQWLRQIVENFKKENMQRAIKINIKISDEIPPIKIDKDALSQAIYNLLDNAIKFSADKKGIEIVVKREKENLVIKVKDDGIGIPRSEWEKIFEKFYQGKNAIKYSSRGTGLGLTLVKHTLEAHGGKVSVESKEGQGSKFSLILPINYNMV